MIRMLFISFLTLCLFSNKLLAAPMVSAQAYKGEPFVARIILPETDVRNSVKIRLARKEEYTSFQTVYPEFLAEALVLRSKRDQSVTIIRALKPASASNFDLIICRMSDEPDEFYRFNISVTSVGTVVSEIQNLSLNQNPNSRPIPGLTDGIGITKPTGALDQSVNANNGKYSTAADSFENSSDVSEPVSKSIAKIRKLQSELQKLKTRSPVDKSKTNKTKDIENNSENIFSDAPQITPIIVKPPIPPSRGAGPIGKEVQQSPPQNNIETYYSSTSLRLEDIQSHTEIVVLKLALALAVAFLFALGLFTLYYSISRRLDRNDNIFEIIKENSSEKTNKFFPSYFAPYPYHMQPGFNQFANSQPGFATGPASASGAYGDFGFSIGNPNLTPQSPLHADVSSSSQYDDQSPHVDSMPQSRENASSPAKKDNSAHLQARPGVSEKETPKTGLRTVSNSRPTRSATLNADKLGAAEGAGLRNNSSAQRNAGGSKGSQPQEPNSAPLSEDLQLAIVYQNMGDLGMARTVLHKVITEGNPEEKAFAQEILSQIDSKS